MQTQNSNLNSNLNDVAIRHIVSSLVGNLDAAGHAIRFMEADKVWDFRNPRPARAVDGIRQREASYFTEDMRIPTDSAEAVIAALYRAVKKAEAVSLPEAEPLYPASPRSCGVAANEWSPGRAAVAA